MEKKESRLQIITNSGRCIKAKINDVHYHKKWPCTIEEEKENAVYLKVEADILTYFHSNENFPLIIQQDKKKFVTDYEIINKNSIDSIKILY